MSLLNNQGGRVFADLLSEATGCLTLSHDQRRQPNQQQRQSAQTIDFKRLKAVLLQMCAQVQDKSDYSLEQAKQFAGFALKHLMSWSGQRDEVNANDDENVQDQNQKSDQDCCADTAVLVLTRMAENDFQIAQYLATQLASLLRHYERRPMLKQPEPLLFFYYHGLQMSRSLVRAAKEKELASKLIGHISHLYDTRSGEPKENLNSQGAAQSPLNLNQLIGLSDFRVLTDQQQVVTAHGGPGGGTTAHGQTLESLKSSVRGGISSRGKDISPTKVAQQQDARQKQNRPLNINVRANSEPPQDLFNRQIAEEAIDDRPQDLRQKVGLRVPPIMVDQIRQNNNTPVLMTGLQTTSTAVMHNFFNMPHEQREQRVQELSGARPASQASKYKQTYQNQNNVIAQTRLTRRQFSLSRTGAASNKQRDTKAKNSQSPKLDRHNPYSDTSPRKAEKQIGVPKLNLNQVKDFDNQKSKSIERQISNFVNVPQTQQQIQPQLSDEGEEQDASFQQETQILNGVGNSADKLKQLALQLGESCLTNDLAALVSQKREFDLAMTARKVVHKPEFAKQMQMVSKMKRSKSIMLRANSNLQVIGRSLGIKEKTQGAVSVSHDQINRLLVLNLIELLLRDHTVEEAQFMRKPINLFTCFLSSDASREQKRDAQILELHNGIDLKKQHQNSIDTEYRYIYWNLNGNTASYNASDLLRVNNLYDRNIAMFYDSTSDSKQLLQLLSSQQNLFSNCKLLSESRAIQKILQKFAFVNENIVKTQTQNELCSFTARESNSTTYTTYSKYGQQLAMRETPNSPFKQQSQTSLRGQVTPKPTSLNFKDCISMIANPMHFWSNNGIGYDISQTKERKSSQVAQSSIKRRLDGVLYQISRRILSVLNQGYELTSFDFADSLTAEITALTSYIEGNPGRLVLQQFIDVCIEPIFRLKKALVEVTLEYRILAMDFTKNLQPGEVSLKSGKVKSCGSDLLIDSENQNQTPSNLAGQERAAADPSQDGVRNELIKCQRRLRDLFSEFLFLISNILKRQQTEESRRLLNDVFVNDEVWNEAVKAFTISLFLADLIAPMYQRQNLTQRQLEVCENLRGINLVNFEEKVFMDTLSLLQDANLVTLAQDTIFTYFLQATNVLKYLKSITKFFKQVNLLYFPSTFEPKHQKAPKADQQPKEVTSHEQEQSSQKKSDQKYWKNVIRNTLYQLMYLIVHPNGLLYLYLQQNCLNYASATGKNRKSALNFKITKNVLEFLAKIFDLPGQFTKYVFTEELMLFYIRTHYISFVKLYNKNFKRQNEICEKTEQPIFVPSIELCRRHIECLFAIAKQRNEDTRRQLYQFKICQFLLQEIGLEYELQQKQKTFMKFRQQEQTKLSKPPPSTQQQQEPTTPSDTVTKQQPLGKIPLLQVNQNPPLSFYSTVKNQAPLSTLVQNDGKSQEKPPSVEDHIKPTQQQPDQTILQQPPAQQLPLAKKAPFIPALKVGGLGLSTLVKDNGGKTQEELDVEAQVQSNKFQQQQSQQQQPAKEQLLPRVAPKIPSLNVGGLGFSTLIKDQGKTQEELDVDALVKQKPQQPPRQDSQITDDSSDDFAPAHIKQSQRSSNDRQKDQTKNLDGESSDSDESYYRELERLKAAKPQPQPQKPTFKLSLGGLGLSTLVREGGGKTQEELDVDACVQQSKQTQQHPKLKTIEQEQPARVFSRNTNFDKTEPMKVVQSSAVAGVAQQDFRQSVDVAAARHRQEPAADCEQEEELRRRQQEYVISKFDQSQLPLYDHSKCLDSQVSYPISSVPPPLEVQQISNIKMDDIIDAQEVARSADIPPPGPQQSNIQVTEEMLYLNERSARPLYQDEQLHIMMLSLMMCLLLKPQRGTLDELYCSQFPIDNENQNFLYLLHFHLSHQANQDIVPKLLEKMSEVSPQLAGYRLLKLLCPSLFDLSLYGNGKGWKKLAEGAYGVVYEVELNMSEPRTVAIKQMNQPQSIYDRCVLHDIFAEITCLEEFRLESCVTDLYDYGVDDTSYYIVMKKYSGSLRDWRLKQSENMQENLSLYLSIFKEILNCFVTIHSHNVTHYDIKCDNILIDFKKNTDQAKYQHDLHDCFAITVGDFGECHMYCDEGKDEFQSRNKGTERIKSPEMLQLAIATRKDTEKYDRRKRVGTNNLSDVWGLGCLFYELLTGDVLFIEEDYFEFHMLLTHQTSELLTEAKQKKLKNNTYLIDFMKYVLVRDMQLRPSIDNVCKRFEHIHALLVTTSSATNNRRFNSRALDNIHSLQSNNVGMQLSTLLERAAMIMENDGRAIDVSQVLSCSQQLIDNSLFENVARSNFATGHDCEQRERHMPDMMRIMEDVFLASDFWLERRSSQALKLGITHVILDKSYRAKQLKDMFTVLEVDCQTENSFKLVASVMDFLRRVALFRGRVMFVESHEKWTEISGKNHTLAEAMLICLSSVFQTSAYESYTLIKSQNLFFKMDSRRLIDISNFVQLCDHAQTYLMTYPQFSCVCGACLIILKRTHATYQNMPIVACRCCHYYKNVETSQCPSSGCNDLVTFLQTYYPDHVEKQNMLPERKLHWGFVRADDFMFGPNQTGCTQKPLQRQVAMNLSFTIDANSQCEAVIEKLNMPDQQSSASMRQKYSRKPPNSINFNQVMQAPMTGTIREPRSQQWQLMKCSQCSVWTHAYNAGEDRYAILLNNRLPTSHKEQRLGLLTHSMKQTQVRVPILEKQKLQTPF